MHTAEQSRADLRLMAPRAPAVAAAAAAAAPMTPSEDDTRLLRLPELGGSLLAAMTSCRQPQLSACLPPTIEQRQRHV